MARIERIREVVTGPVDLEQWKQKTEAGWQGWAREFVEELTYWPFSTTLDQGDAAGGAYTLLALTRLRVGPARPKNAGLPA